MLSLLADSPTALVALAFVVGLVIGSFLNVVIHRLPIMLDRQWREQCLELDSEHAATKTPAELATNRYDLVVPRSACPSCKAPIRAWHNIPVLSWLLLRGRCADCRAPISVRYPLIELLCAVLTAAVAWHFGFGWQAACAGVVTWFLIALTGIDLDHQLLPDSLTLPLLWGGLMASLGWTVFAKGSLPVGPADAIIGGWQSGPGGSQPTTKEVGP